MTTKNRGIFVIFVSENVKTVTSLKSLIKLSKISLLKNTNKSDLKYS